MLTNTRLAGGRFHVFGRAAGAGGWHREPVVCLTPAGGRLHAEAPGSQRQADREESRETEGERPDVPGSGPEGE